MTIICREDKNIRIAKKICKILKENNKKCYIVGGSIRDFVLGIPIHDLDMTTDAIPEEIIDIFRNKGFKVIPTGIKFGTVTVIVDNEPVEITTFRMEGKYTDYRHPETVKYTKNINYDLSRRDFTINAIAYDPYTEQIVDPFNGIEDIKNKIIRAVGSPDERFIEDPLRMYRACRFKSKLNFSIENKTEQAIKQNSELCINISVERIRDEILKTLETSKPSYGIDCFVKTGLFNHILPEFLKLINLEQPSEYHTYDVYKHTLCVIDNIPSDKPILRIAGMFHDIGKPYCKSVKKGRITFLGHEKISVEIFKLIAKRLKLSNVIIKYVSLMIANHMRFYNPKWSNSAIRRLVNSVGEDNFKDLTILMKADFRAGIKTKDYTDELIYRYLEMKKKSIPTSLTIKDLKINGHDIMKVLNIKPSPKIGKILNCILELVIEKPELNKREILLEILKEINFE